MKKRCLKNLSHAECQWPCMHCSRFAVTASAPHSNSQSAAAEDASSCLNGGGLEIRLLEFFLDLVASRTVPLVGIPPGPHLQYSSRYGEERTQRSNVNPKIFHDKQSDQSQRQLETGNTL